MISKQSFNAAAQINSFILFKAYRGSHAVFVNQEAPLVNPNIMRNDIMAKKSGAQIKNFCECRRRKLNLRDLKLKIQTASPPQKELPPQRVLPPHYEFPPQRMLPPSSRDLKASSSKSD
jgi:hypothetical protein